MAQPLRLEWTKENLPQELIDLRCYLELLPQPSRDRVLPLIEKVGHFVRLQSRLVKIAQDAVDQLQLDTKYLQFDLEVTRQERNELKLILEDLDE